MSISSSKNNRLSAPPRANAWCRNNIQDDDEDKFETPDEYLSDMGADVPELDPYSGSFMDNTNKNDAKLIFEH